VQLFRRHAPRPRLTALLDEATAQSILITAPAGYGKTTLAREWLQHREDVAWYHATSMSADLGAFSVGLAESVAHIVPDAGERVRQRLRVGDSVERLARPLAELMAEDLDPWPGDAIIVLDDYHFLAESAPVETFLDWLLMLAPIRLLVTTRRRPGWATARRFLYGEAVEIGRDKLAMTPAEAQRVLQGRSTREVRALVRQAEGWPAVIGLAALSSDLEFPAEKVSESLFRYFAEEVLRREPADVQRFMLVAAVPSSVDVRLARSVLGFEDPEKLFERLLDEDLVGQPAVGAFRFHPLVRDFLRRKLKADDPGAFTERAQLVIEDAKARSNWEEAFELTLELGRLTDAADVAGRAARTLLSTGQSETLEKWLSACGSAAVTVPGAALARAELMIRKGEMSTAAALAAETAERLSEDHPDFAWASNLAGRALHFTSEEEPAFERFAAAKAAATADEDLKDALWGLLLTATEIAPETMSDYLDELEERYWDDIDVRLRLATGRALAGELETSFAGVWKDFEALFPAVEYSNDPLAASSFLATASSVAVLRGEYGLAQALATRTIDLCKALRLEFALGACYAQLSAAEIGLRRFSRAEKALKLCTRSRIWHEDPYLQIEGLTLKTRLLASQGALQEALSTESQLPPSYAKPRSFGVYLGTIALIQAAQGNTTDARRTADRALRYPTGVETRFSAQLAQAIAHYVERGTATANRLLSRMVQQCNEAQYLDGLVFAYRIFPSLLTAVREPGAVSILSRALALSHDTQLARRAQIRIALDESNDELKILTPREREVMVLLSQGLTNSEIATHLVIATSTAKVHVRHILEKLGARNRLEAVLRSRMLLEDAEG
jgi:LuxR family transcriptional regulator, maltose regulon positive regulatory protein